MVSAAPPTTNTADGIPGAADGLGQNAPERAVSTAAAVNVQNILTQVVEHVGAGDAIVVFDQRCGLASLLTTAYRACLPKATFLDFDAESPDSVLAALTSLPPGQLAVLIQSTNFRLQAFRLRVELFKRGLKVVEHPHLTRMRESEYATYVDALAYDAGYYRGVGAALKRRIDAAGGAVIDSGGARLTYDSRFEPAKLNVGDYTGMKNIGGQFPIGEVFTEPADLRRVNGHARIFAFGDGDFHLNQPPHPITLVIADGLVTDVIDSTAAFDRVLANIRLDEPTWVRELGFGMNRAMTRARLLSDTGSYERMCGIHLSLGAKHNVYNKPDLKRRATKNHVDVFVSTEQVWLDDVPVFIGGGWRP